MLGARFTKDVLSGLIIEFDVITNRGQFDAVTDETRCQSSDELLLDPLAKFVK